MSHEPCGWCSTKLGVIECAGTDCKNKLCNECVDVHPRCTHCQSKVDEQHRRDRLSKKQRLEQQSQTQKLTKQQKQELQNLVYTQTQEMIIQITNTLIRMPFDSFLGRIERSEAIAPLIHPEIYMRGNQHLQIIKRLARVFAGIVEELEQAAIDAPNDMEANNVWRGLGLAREFIKKKREVSKKGKCEDDLKDEVKESTNRLTNDKGKETK